MVISIIYLLIILLIWLLKYVYLSNTYFYEHYFQSHEGGANYETHLWIKNPNETPLQMIHEILMV